MVSAKEIYKVLWAQKTEKSLLPDVEQVGMRRAKTGMKTYLRFLKYFRRLGHKRRDNVKYYKTVGKQCWNSGFGAGETGRDCHFALMQREPHPRTAEPQS